MQSGSAGPFERPERVVGAELHRAVDVLFARNAVAERVILAIVNEAYRALGDGVAVEEDIDRALQLGANHPFGPFEWTHQTGLHEVVVMLDALSDEDADTFRPALTLLRATRAGI